MGKKGGAMPGAGRPKGLKNKKTIDKEKRQAIFEKALFDAVMKDKKNYYRRTYQQRNNAVKEIIDRILGKAQDHIDLTSKGESITVVSMDYQSGKKSDISDKKE